MGRETSMLYSYFWTLAQGNCSVFATEISRLFLQNVIFLKVNTWNTNEHENHALSGLNLKKNQKKKNRCDTADNLTCHNQRLIHTHIAISRKIWRLTWNQKGVNWVCTCPVITLYSFDSPICVPSKTDFPPGWGEKVKTF